MNKIKFCEKCKKYTMKDECAECNENSIRRIPPRYSPDDKNAKYRRKTKKEILKKRGLL